MNHLLLFRNFIQELFSKRDIVLELTKRDFKTKYLGSYLGIVWAFVHPTVYIVILWFVFQVGFKTPSIDNVPFVLWMMAGIIPWFFFSEAMTASTNAVLENSFMVKKVAFSLGLLPLVKILSSMMIHLFLMTAVMVMATAYGYMPTVHNLQLLYYLAAGTLLLTGLSWLTSSLIIFSKDVGQVVNVVLQFAFWMTPLFWSAKMLPPTLHNLIKLNPVYYLVQGYREALIYKVWFWEQHPLWTAYFWAVTGSFLFLGAVVFRRLRSHFADVL